MKTKKQPNKATKKPEYTCPQCGAGNVAEALWQELNEHSEKWKKPRKEGYYPEPGPFVEGEELYYCSDCCEVMDSVNRPED